MFNIRILLTDDHPELPLTRTYDLRIAIVKDWRDPVKMQIEDAKKTEVIENYDSLVYDLT